MYLLSMETVQLNGKKVGISIRSIWVKESFTIYYRAIMGNLFPWSWIYFLKC